MNARGAMDGRDKFRVYYTTLQPFEKRGVTLMKRAPHNKVVLADSEIEAAAIIEGRYASSDALVSSVVKL